MADSLINPLKCVKDVGKWIVTEVLWPPVKLHIDYWWCFDGNVQGLRDEIGRLERERRDMEGKIEDARLRAESATTEVQNWSNEGTQKLEEATRILQGCDDLKLWKIISRYSVGKSAKKTTEGISKLRNEGNSIRIADPTPPASMVSLSHAPTLEFHSRKRIEEDIMESLKDGNVRMIAICGAGGVGKTTMEQRIEDRAIKEKLFDEVLPVVISQQIDMFKIQKQIAEMLGLALSEDTLAGRAHKLRTRLMDSKRKLIILDDVWESFELKDIGVPYANGLGGCKIILTSRLKDVCEEMEADKVVEIQVLDKKEAWTLFREKSGDCVDASHLRPTAEEVAAECKGLPIALVTVGKALQKKNIETWKDALLQLRRANPTNFLQVRKNVYMPLKLSYDFLETESEKSLFLLCGLFPEDYNIRIEDLALLSFGLGMFEGINNIEDGRNRTQHLLERLRSRFLLMTGRKEQEVKMHDVVRDVAIFIGSKEKQGFLNVSSMDSCRNCNWMSVEISNIANAKLPVGLDFPNLHLLMLLNFNYLEFPEGFDVNVVCFKGMEELKVLYFSNQKFQSLPSSLEFLKKLRKLHLKNCEVKDISIVGELASLEILRVLRCNKIKELPADVGELKFLKLLELRDCKKLKRIVAGVISSLVGLEELKIVDCFNKWEAKGNVSEERNASLSELESLINLTCLEIDIFDPKLVTQEILLSKQLRRYQIRAYGDRFLSDGRKHERRITLQLPRDVTVGNWIRGLGKNTQSLELDGDGSNDFNLGEIESLREFVFQNCSTVEKLMNAIDWKFSMLEHLELRDLEELEEIIDGTIPEGSNSFQNLESLVVQYLPKLGYLWKSPNQNVSLVNLKSIYISSCPNLRYLFSMATARSLVQLQSLQISLCDTIEQVLWNEMESNTEASIIEFPKLKTLQLCVLPNLIAFTQGVEIVKFPQLIELDINYCPKLRTKIDPFPAGMIEKIIVRNHDTIEEIFRDDGNRHIIFQELYELNLLGLPCLTTFYRGVESIKFPKLKVLTIGNLPRLNSFVAIDSSEPTHDHHSIHFFCNKKVEIIGLNELYLHHFPDKINKIWCRHISTGFFHNLEGLHIYKVDGITNLISSSTAKALVNLKALYIKYCKEMIDVIEDETHVTVNYVFPNLEYLDIESNCKLRSFCQWKHAFDLPSLVNVRIANCSLMKTFTLGSLSTPKLHRFQINYEDIEIKDLNGSIQRFISTKNANEDENKDEYNENEKHEDKKETEGEDKTESSNNNLM
ncbi:probable disease resistance protein At4g27220 isoform X2 [Primulina eburnea]|uniref:probable disease resistance protein At4g27220 isoform X2 n=1 Tax=Primulina eburnea TaxID=1245227 RepID=UPI003C6C0156